MAGFGEPHRVVSDMLQIPRYAFRWNGSLLPEAHKSARVRATGRENVNSFFNAVSWLAMLLVVACLCYFVSLGLGSLVIKVMPVLHRFLQAGVPLCGAALTLFAMARLMRYLSARES